MDLEVKFIANTDLALTIEKLIQETARELLLISPYIDLDDKLMALITDKTRDTRVQIKVLFGKNKANINKSIKEKSLNFLKSLPNIELRHHERLHAKYYQNEFDFIITSLNLYDFSVAKNIEIGVVGNYGSKGLIGKAVDTADRALTKGYSKIKTDVLGFTSKDHPVQFMRKVYESSEILFDKKPKVPNTLGLSNFLKKHTFSESEILIDKLASPLTFHQKTSHNHSSTYTPVTTANHDSKSPSQKTLSATKLSQQLGMTRTSFISRVTELGFVKDNEITTKGTEAGCVWKKFDDKPYIAYPVDLLNH